jgi:hypothetical protein
VFRRGAIAFKKLSVEGAMTYLTRARCGSNDHPRAIRLQFERAGGGLP